MDPKNICQETDREKEMKPPNRQCFTVPQYFSLDKVDKMLNRLIVNYILGDLF